MKIVSSILALAVTAAFATACDRPKTGSTAYNNSGASATPGSTTTNATSSPVAPSTSSATPTMAPGPAGDATGVMSETVTTGKIKAALAADSGMKDSDVTVTTNNGVVMLSGTVKSQDQVSIATNVAQKQEGVGKVESTITVR